MSEKVSFGKYGISSTLIFGKRSRATAMTPGEGLCHRSVLNVPILEIQCKLDKNGTFLMKEVTYLD